MSHPTVLVVCVIWIIGQSELCILCVFFVKHAVIFSIYFFAYLMLPLFLEAPVRFLSFHTCHILKSLVLLYFNNYFLQAWDYSHAHSSQFLLSLLLCLLLPLYENFWKTLLSPKTSVLLFQMMCYFNALLLGTKTF